MKNGDCVVVNRKCTVREYHDGAGRHELKIGMRGVVIRNEMIGLVLVAVDGIKPTVLIPSHCLDRSHDPETPHVAD